MAWLYLFLASLCETTWVIGLKWASRHPRWWPLLLVGAISIGGFLLLSRALRDLPLGMCYAIWTGMATIGAMLGGILIYGESFEPRTVFWLLFIIIGVCGLRISHRDVSSADSLTSPPAVSPNSLPGDK